MKNSVPVVPVVVLTLLALGALAAALHPGSHIDREPSPIVFVCENGVAMSVWSALTFNRLAAEHGLPVRASSRAAAPTFTHVPLRMKLALLLDGHDLVDYRPRVISAADVRQAERVILIDTELPPAASAPGATLERWGGFPPMREQYFSSRTALRTRVEGLLARLAASAGR
jgi:hypothetical protein